MLTIYRRHLRACTHRAEGRSYRRCHCPIWADGRLGGVEIRRSLGLKDWQKAQDKVRDWEAEGQRKTEPDPITLRESWQRFLTELETRRLSRSTMRKYRLLSRQMQNFAEYRGVPFLSGFDLDTTTAFRQQWHDGPLSSAKKLERLRAFFRFACEREWLSQNPAAKLKPPQVSLRPTLPFTQDEVARILRALDTYRESTSISGRENALRLRALVLLLRYSGMRISDVVKLAASSIRGNRLFLYTQKTGVPVSTVLPDFVLRVLEQTPRVAGENFFWSGSGQVESVVRSWQNRLHRLFTLAKIPSGHAHRFRDTFAVELLLAGVPMERVSVLLGHQSVRITEKHYNPWVRTRQEQLEADIERAWLRDPLVLLETKGTQKVHGESERPN